jgi:hypothetical protein
LESSTSEGSFPLSGRGHALCGGSPLLAPVFLLVQGLLIFTFSLLGVKCVLVTKDRRRFLMHSPAPLVVLTALLTLCAVNVPVYGVVAKAFEFPWEMRQCLVQLKKLQDELIQVCVPLSLSLSVCPQLT